MQTRTAGLLAAVAALALAGCGRGDRQAPAPAESLRPLPSAQPSPPAAAAPASDECGADRLAEFRNRAADERELAAIRARSGAERVRVIRPGEAVTMDYLPRRLNVELGDDGRIARFRCG